MSTKTSRLENYIDIALRGYGKLPPFISEVAGVTDRQTSLQLWEYFAGKTLYVPRAISKDAHDLIQAVGHDAAKAICQSFWGDHYEIPQGPWCGAGRKWMKILRSLQESKSIRLIAIEVELSERNVYLCKKRLSELGFHFTSYRIVTGQLKRQEDEPLIQEILTGRRNGVGNKGLAESLGVPLRKISNVLEKLKRDGVDVPRLRRCSSRQRPGRKALPPG